MEEKKVKKISEMNVDAFQAVGNGSISSSSMTSPIGYLPNGGCSERPYGHFSYDLSFPPGGFPSLRLPVVVVLYPAYWTYKIGLQPSCMNVYNAFKRSASFNKLIGLL